MNQNEPTRTHPRRDGRLELAAAVPPARHRAVGRQHAGPALPAPTSAADDDFATPSRSRGVTPNLVGVSHLSFSVPDLAAAVQFWVEVLGFEPMNDDPEFRFLFHRGARVAVIVTDHGGTVRDVFDEHHPGLDHLALAVTDVDTLEQWRTLDERGVPHSGVVPSDGGWHLNLRAPGNFPVELFVIGEAFARSLGLDPAEPAVAAVTEPRGRGPARSATAGRACAAPRRGGARRSSRSGTGRRPPRGWSDLGRPAGRPGSPGT